MKRLILFLVVLSPLFAEEAPEEKRVRTEHAIQVDGKSLEYTAEAGTLFLLNEKEEPEAEIFYIYYKKKGDEKRPISFFFNGGPGTAATFLHLGGFGPRKVKLGAEGEPLYPCCFEDNPYTLLNVSDLVFVDPVSTGLSRTVEKGDVKKFLSVDGDIESCGEFIYRFVTREKRWGSPKYLVGESYGSLRVSGLSSYLFDEYLMKINGAILISSIIDFLPIDFKIGNDVPYMTFLPTYSAISWYQGKLSKKQFPTVESAAQAAKSYAFGPYAELLLKGNRISTEEKQAAAKKLSTLTGLDESFILRNRLRITSDAFQKELLRKEEKVVSRIDGRFTGWDMKPQSNSVFFDPNLTDISVFLTQAMNEWLSEELSWKSEREYRLFSHEKWDYCKAKNCYVNMSKDLVGLMSEDPDFRLYIAAGIYDLATPFAASLYSFDHLPIAEPLQKNITFKLFPAGHVIFLSDLKQMSTDLRQFIH